MEAHIKKLQSDVFLSFRFPVFGFPSRLLYAADVSKLVDLS